MLPEPLRRIAVPAFGPSLLFGIGEGAILPAVALSARELGASVPTAALVVTLIAVGSLAGTLPASLITMRHGERSAIVAAAIGGAVAMALCALTGSLAAFAVGAFVVGIAQAVFNLARQSYLTEAISIEYRARAMSMLGGTMRVGMFVGPFLAAAAIHAFGLAAAYAVGVVALLLAALVGARLPDLETPSTPAEGTVAPTWRSILREHRGVFATVGIGVLLLAGVRAARQAVIPLWADHLMLDASVAALIYGLAGGVEMLVFYPAGHLMDRRGRRAVAVPSLLIMGVALLATPLTTGAGTLLLAAAAIGFGNGISSGLVMTLGADHAPRGGRAHFLGVWRLLAELGASCGPALLSLLTSVLSLGAGIAAIGLIAFAAAAQLAWWIPRSGASGR